MKFIIETAVLQGLLSAARITISRRDTIPILNFIRIEATENKVEVRSTDMDKDLTVYAAVQTSELGATVAEFAHLADWAKTLPAGSQVEVHQDDNSLVARCGRARCRVPTLDVADYPAFATIDAPARFEIGTADLARILRITVPAASTEETRYYLMGVHLLRRDDVFRAEATNGNILSVTGMPAPAGSENMPAIILPSDAANAILALSENTGNLSVAVSETRFTAETEHWRFSTRLIEGTFPNLDFVIPSQKSRTVSVGGAELSNAVRRVALAAEQVEKGVRAVRLDFTDGEITVSAGTKGHSDSEDVVDGHLDGEPISIVFNSAYLRGLLDTRRFDNLVIETDDALKPVLLRERGAPPYDVSVLMPRRG